MPRKIDKSLLPFEVDAALQDLARVVSDARKVRMLTQRDLSAKAGIGVNTMVQIEKGDPGVQMVAWLRVLWALDMLSALKINPEDDTLAIKLMGSQLPKRVKNG